MTMPGIPCIYYGSEWGIEGTKNWNDSDLRPSLETLSSNELTKWIQTLIIIKKKESSFSGTDYTQIALTNTATIFERDQCWVCINMDENPCTLWTHQNATFIDN